MCAPGTGTRSRRSSPTRTASSRTGGSRSSGWRNGAWVDVAAAQITAPAVGQTATYRFVNDRIPAVALPLTGGASTDGFLLAGSALLVLTGALALWQWRRRTRVHGI